MAGYDGITLAAHLFISPSVVPPSIHPFDCLSIFSFPDDNLGKCQWIFTKLGMCIDIVNIWFGTINRQISFFFLTVICQ